LEATVAAARDGAGAAPEEKLLAVGLAYVQFALDNPTSYQLMFSAVLENFSDYEELKTASSDAYEVVLGVLRELLAQRGNAELTVSQAGVVAWSAVHGISSLLLFGRQKGAATKPQSPLRSLAELDEAPAATLRLLLRGLTG
jgi:AcrR family transcriptional regulator